ncbi:MAG: sulfatase-like hydrolase/transferase, partial [Rhodospirillales bacterium]|nr:sulfatase-like hydrolase/transferase [Rhodospirillales bacterium]
MHVKIRRLICVSLALFLLLGLLFADEAVSSEAASCQAGTPNQAPLNVLVLYADDWRHDTLGAAGNPVVQTPQLDKLASQGVRFTHNCVTTSICWVSRANLLTGQWMSRHGSRTVRGELDWDQTYPTMLRRHGYHVGHVGKWHNGRFPGDKYDFWRTYHGKHWYPADSGERIHVTQRNEKDALAFLSDRPKDKPFCLTIAFFATHAVDHDPDQFLPQPQSMRLYTDIDIPVPPNATEVSWQRLPDFFTEKNEGRNRWHWRFDTPQKYQRMMKNYYRLATEVDATCGRVIEELDRQGVLDNTLIIFTSDNGLLEGEHGMVDKRTGHEPSIRIPL